MDVETASLSLTAGRGLVRSNGSIMHGSLQVEEGLYVFNIQLWWKYHHTSLKWCQVVRLVA